MSDAGDSSLELWQEIRDIYRVGLKRLNARLALEGITFSQYSVLLALGRAGPMPMSRLGEHMLVAPANVTGLVDRMEERGYVRRRRDPSDRRLYIIEPTERGARLYRIISTRFRQYMRNIGSPLSEEELLGAVASLAKVKKRIDGMPEL
jgi:DNA-binding MarR family transcriptional regulator